LRIRLLSVGRPRDTLATALVERYARRIRAIGIRFELEQVPEIPAGGRYSDAHRLERESLALVARLPSRSHVIALDPRGRPLTSEAVADSLPRWATPEAAFVVGGPVGLGTTILDRAEVRWSLSSATFPHELARALVAEQIYRALARLRGIPYAK
jgi:23S rRNA (pseudouridine1915-N3)-methyltransferase